MVENDEPNEIHEFEIEYLDQNIDQLDDSFSSKFLIKSNYHYAMVSNNDSGDNFEQGISDLSCTKNVFQATPQRSSDLRSGVKKVPQDRQRRIGFPAKQVPVNEKRQNQ